MRSATQVSSILGAAILPLLGGGFVEDLPHILRRDESGDLFERNFDACSLCSFT